MYQISEKALAEIFECGSAVAAADVEPVKNYDVADNDEDYEDGAGCWVGD